MPTLRKNFIVGWVEVLRIRSAKPDYGHNEVDGESEGDADVISCNLIR